VKLFLCIILTLLNLSLNHANFTQQPWELLANARYNAAANRPNRPSRVVANVNRAEGEVAGSERTAQVFRV
jgi:hypothetical protein